MNINLIFYSIIFLFGLSIGSFLNCIIYRLHTISGQSFLKGRSFCPYCRHQLIWKDLIPLFSFFLLKGKCRYCHQKISWQYPLVELTTAILFASIFYLLFSIFYFQNLLTLFYYLVITSFLIIIFVYDLKHYIIPDRVIYPAIAIVFLFHGITSRLGFEILPALFFLLIILISRERWLGFGDFKLAIFMGLFLGYPKVLVALFFSFFIGAIIGIGLILAKKKTLKSRIPFGPFLVTGTFGGLFFGQVIINWYLSLFI